MFERKVENKVIKFIWVFLFIPLSSSAYLLLQYAFSS